MSLSITILEVGIMLLYAVPGFVLIKSKAVRPDSISAFAKLLMYVCQPCLSLYSFQKVSFSKDLSVNMLLFFILTLIIQVIIMAAFHFLLRKKYNDVRYRICNVAVCFGNCAFMGVPLVEAIMPDYPEAVIFSAMYALSMNVLGWTVASAIIARDSRYMKPAKIFLNPQVIVLPLAVFLYCTGYQFPDRFNDMITLMGKMTTPLCMIILGMRLATNTFKEVFGSPFQYMTVLVKQILMPLFALALVAMLPVDYDFKITMYILCACPVASVVLNFSEMIGCGQKTAANMTLLGTMMSVVTIPLMTLFI